MRCAKASDMLSDYLDGRLSPASQVELGIHLESCPRCAADLNFTRSMLEDLAGLATRDTGLDLWPGISAAIRSAEREKSLWRRLLVRPAAYAPALALALVLAALTLGPEPGPGPTDSVYKAYISAHSQLQSAQPLTDRDFDSALGELEHAVYTSAAQKK